MTAATTTPSATTTTTTTQPGKIDRSVLESVLNKRFFYQPSFALYGGVAGFYDYGPPGCALLSNILSVWRQHFILEEDMHELDCTIMTPHDILKTSGHVDKFTDWMVRDPKTGEIFRADHLVEAVLEGRLEGDKEARGTAIDGADKKKKDPKKKAIKKGAAVALDDAVRAEYENILTQIDNYTGKELGEFMQKHEITNPETGNELTAPVEFNLMFESSIGPTGHLKGYLRPETAQGMFLNFKKLLEFNQDKMPFAAAQIGRAFRNEISPRQGLLRVREFTMAEIEHFVDPSDKSHKSFKDVQHIKMMLLPAVDQIQGKSECTEMTIGDAVEKGVVDNQTLGYFMARIHLFLLRIGINPERLRFRQHMSNEMAHYACDCWDAEIHSSYGWIECVGCADRSAYDLTVHSERTKVPLVVRENLPAPITLERWLLEFNKKTFGLALKKAAKLVEEYLLKRTQVELEKLATSLTKDGFVTVSVADVEHKLTKDMITIVKGTVTETVREYTPNVIEPSFGIGRILYSLIEHVWWTREGDDARSVFSFPACVAPFKVLLLPLSSHESLVTPVQNLAKRIRRLNIPMKIDDSSASVGKRYARNDELGTPYGITVDFQTVKDDTITLRERDSTKQIREKTSVILQVVKDLIDETTTWAEVSAKYTASVEQNID